MAGVGLIVVLFVCLTMICCPKQAYADASAHTRDEAVAYLNSLVGQNCCWNDSTTDCVDVAQYYYNWLGVGARSGNGCAYATGNRPEGWVRIYSDPQPGDVAAWDSNHNVSTAYGHVACVVAVNGNTITTVEQSTTKRKKAGHNVPCFYATWRASSPSSYLRPNFRDGSLDKTPPTVTEFRIGEINGSTFTAMAKITDAGGVSSVQYKVWTDANHQDDIKTYQGHCTDGNDIYWARIPWSEHNNERGRYTVHLYAYDAAGNLANPGITYDFDSSGPSVNDFHVGELRDGAFTVFARIASPNGLSSVRYAIWTSSGGQDDIQWYNGNNEGNGIYWARVNFSEHKDERGEYIIHLYAYDSAGVGGSQGITYNFDGNGPSISDVRIAEVSRDGYTVLCTVKDEQGILRVQFPTWTNANGQDDLASEWLANTAVRGKADGDTYSFRVNTSEHNNELGEYITHIYAWDGLGNRSKVEMPWINLSNLSGQPPCLVGVADSAYQLQSKVGGRLLYYNEGGDESASVLILPVSDNEHQSWQIAWDATAKAYFIRNQATGKYLAANGNYDRYSYLTQMDAPNLKDGAWVFEDAGGGWVYIRNRNGYYLDVAGFEDRDGACVWAHTYNGCDAQKWRLVAPQLGEVVSDFPEGVYTIRCSANPSSVIEIADMSVANDANVRVWEDNGSDAQRFRFKRNDDGSFTITNVHSNKSLDVEHARPDAGTNVLQYTTHQEDNQRWFVERADDKTYYLRVKHSGFYLDLDWGKTENGTNVQVYPATGSSQQKFILEAPDTEKPVISDVKVSDISKTGYTVSCKLTDNVGVTRVLFPTWTLANGQDDISQNWLHDNSVLGIKDGNRWFFRVKAADHNNEIGAYVTHIYAWDKAGNLSKFGDDQHVLVDTSARSLDSCIVTLSRASYAFDGTQKSPTVTVKDGSTTLKEGTDYTLTTPSGRTNAGTYTYTVTGKGSYSGTKTATLTITAKSLSSCTVTLSQASYAYDGSQKSPAVTVKDGSTTLAEGTHYTLTTPSGRTNAGTYTYTVTGKGNYAGTKTATLTIGAKNLSSATVTLGQASYAYDGTQKSPAVTVKDGSKTLTKDTDYTLTTPSGRTNAGTYTYTVTGKGNYAGTKTATLTITSPSTSDISAWTVTLSPATFAYDGSQKVPSITVRNGSKTPVENVDYTVTRSNSSVSVGTYTVTVTGKGSYAGTKTATYTITAAPLSSCDVTLSPSTLTYDGTQKSPAVTVKDGSKTLVEGTDYAVSWPEGRTNTGTYTVTLTGKGSYAGTATATFAISQANIAAATVSGIADVPYSGSAVRPQPTVTLGGRKLARGTDYSLSYDNNVKVGTATVFVCGKGNYIGTASSTFAVMRAAIDDADVSAIAAQRWTGRSLKPNPRVVVGGRALAEGTDYTLSYADNIDAGTAMVFVRGIGNYSGLAVANFEIRRVVQTVTASNKEVAIGKTVKLEAKSSGGGKLTYKTSNARVANVAPNGTVRGVRVGIATITITAAETSGHTSATKKVTVKVGKANPITAKAAKGTMTASLKALRAKAVTLGSNIQVSKAQGKVSFANASTNATAKRFAVNASNGKLTIPKGTKKGKYQVIVAVRAAGNGSFVSGTKTVKYYVEVK